METSSMSEDKSSWAVGGGLMLGVGVGFFFWDVPPYEFVGSIIGGLGLGLLVAALLSAWRRSGTSV